MTTKILTIPAQDVQLGDKIVGVYLPHSRTVTVEREIREFPQGTVVDLGTRVAYIRDGHGNWYLTDPEFGKGFTEANLGTDAELSGRIDRGTATILYTPKGL